jgi:hypothetical protein
MTSRTRSFLVGSSLVVLLGLGTGLVAYYGGVLPAATTSAPSEFAYLPVDTTAVAFADVRAIMSSDFSQRIRQMLPTGEEKAKLQDELGLDIEHDIDSVVAGFLGSDPTKAQALAIVRGRFNDGLIETRATAHGAAAETYRDKRLLVLKGNPAEGTPEVAGAPAAAVAFLEPGLIAIGEAGSVRRAIDAGSTKENALANAELMAFVNDLQGTGNAWAVGRTDKLSDSSNSALPDEIRSHLPAVQWVAASAHINGGVSGMLRADARDDQAAAQLRDVIRGGLAAGRLVSGSDKRLEALLNSVQLAGTGKTVSVSFSLPAELLDILNGAAAMHGLTSGR